MNLTFLCVLLFLTPLIDGYKSPINILESNSKKSPNANYEVGVGIHDITGPAGGVGMMGYATPVSLNP